jgi:isoquinoline 1-oxidoreductase alpha subunit
MATSLEINGRTVQVEAAPDTPLLWVLREEVGLTGPKFGCGIGQCGACTVLADGAPVRSCSLPVSVLSGMKITTIEGLGGTHPLQQAWTELDVAQCGYCQPGQLMTAAALLRDNPKPTDEDIDGALAGNICRCGTYTRIRQGIKRAAELTAGGKEATR